MGMGTAIGTVFRKFFVLAGRARRSEFWWWILFVAIIAIILRFVDLAIGLNIGTSSTLTTTVNGVTTTSEGPKPLGVFSSLWALIVFIPTITVSVRRLHDTGKSGWWWWLNIICCIGGFILFIFYLIKSDPVDNKYGPPPA